MKNDDYKLAVSFSLTSDCNENCGYCYRDPNSTQLLKNEHHEIQKKLIEANTDSIYYTGGEALLMPHLPELMSEAQHAGITTRLNTNGVLLTEDKLRQLKPFLNQVALPFDSLDDGINERVRKNKLHRQIITRSMGMIKDSGDIDIFINTCINKQNIHTVEKLGEFLSKQKLHTWQLRQFFPIRGASTLNKEQFEITDEQYNQILEMMCRSYPNLNIVKRNKQVMEDMCLMISSSGELFRSKNGHDMIFGSILKDDLNIREIALKEKIKEKSFFRHEPENLHT